MSRRNLSKRQKLFVDEYLVDFNATQAAIRAGYRPTSARATGSRNLRRPAVRAAIAAAQAPRLAALDLSAEEVLRELAGVARANVLDYMRIDDTGMPEVDLSGLTRDQAAAIRDIEVEELGEGKGERRRIRFKMHDKLAALDRLARHYGLFREAMSPAEPDATPDKPQHDPRQVARAVLLILREAAVAEEEEGDEADEADEVAATEVGDPRDIAAETRPRPGAGIEYDVPVPTGRRAS